MAAHHVPGDTKPFKRRNLTTNRILLQDKWLMLQRLSLAKVVFISSTTIDELGRGFYE
jgi:hypothetical protein